MSEEIYNAYGDLAKPPTENQVHRGYIQNSSSVPFKLVPPPKSHSGRKYTIEASKNKSMASSLTYYGLALNAVPTHTQIVIKTQEALNLFEELCWNDHVEDLKSQMLKIEEKLAKFKADKLNKFDAKGAKLNDKKLKSTEEKITQCEANLATLLQGVEKTSNRALDVFKNLMGPLKDTVKEVAAEYFNTEVTTTVTKWEAVDIRYMKDINDTDKLLIPLTEYNGDVDDEEADDTTEYKLCVVAKLETQEVTSKPRKDLEAIAEIAYRLLAKKHGFGLAEAQRGFFRNNIKFHTGLTCTAWAELLKKINGYIPLLTTYNDDEQYKDNPDIPNERKSLNEVEMCQVILGSMPRQIQEAYEVTNPSQKIVTELAPIVDTLDALLKQAKSNRAKEQKEKATTPNPTKTSQKKGKDGKASKKGGGGGGGGDKQDHSPTNPRDGGCPDCQKKGKSAWWTHCFADCRHNRNKNNSSSTNTRQLRDHDLSAADAEMFEKFKQWSESERGRDRDYYRHERKRSRSPDRRYDDDYHRGRSYDRDRDYRSGSRNRGYG